jgi:hypothetical protein
MRLKQSLEAATLVLFVSLLSAASTNGNLIGAVYDPKGLPLPGAKVTARNQQSGLARTVLANAEGEYVIALLPPGAYALAAEAPGFARVGYTGITLNVDQVVHFDLNLPISPAKHEIVVTGSVPQLETHSASLGQVVEAREAQALPLNAEREQLPELCAPRA